MSLSYNKVNRQIKPIINCKHGEVPTYTLYVQATKYIGIPGGTYICSTLGNTEGMRGLPYHLLPNSYLKFPSHFLFLVGLGESFFFLDYRNSFHFPCGLSQSVSQSVSCLL